MNNEVDYIVFYDGVCGLCDRLVQFLIKQDHNKKLKFCALQSTKAQILLGKEKAQNLESLFFLSNGKLFDKSSGALQIAKTLGFPWSILIIFLLIPTFIRDGLYRFIANQRYGIFGKYDSCKIPKTEDKERFVC